jgi:hypothetical protein
MLHVRFRCGISGSDAAFEIQRMHAVVPKSLTKCHITFRGLIVRKGGVTSCFRGGLLTLSRHLNETSKHCNYYKRKFIAKGKKLLEFSLENPIGNYKISPQIW